MTTPSYPAPSGQVGPLPGGVYRADGTTRLTATTAAALFTTPASTDPPLQAAEDIYVDLIPDGTVYPASQRELKFRAGQVIKTSQLNAAFPKATIAAIVPATGAHGVTTPVTVTGSGFTPATTLTVGGNAATAVVIQSPVQLTCTVPTASAAGAANVIITNDGGATTVTGGFTYS